MPELELIKLARHVNTFWSLTAFVVLIAFLFGGKVLGGTDGRGVSHVFQIKVLNRVILFLAFVVGAGLFVKVLPLFAFHGTPVHGVVLRKEAQTTVASAQISLDGLFGLATNSDNNGNFQLTVPADQRQDDYTVRAQLSGEVGVAKVKDADAPKTSVSIELPAPVKVVGPPSPATGIHPSPRSQKNSVIAGMVVDQGTNNGIGQATITIAGRTEQDVTEDSGNFRIELQKDAPKRLRLHVTKEGFRPLDITVEPRESLVLPLRKQ